MSAVIAPHILAADAERRAARNKLAAAVSYLHRADEEALEEARQKIHEAMRIVSELITRKLRQI